MTGKEFLKLVTHKGIPLSCIASRINCKLSTLRAMETMDSIPKSYAVKFISAFPESLSDKEMAMLIQ